MGTYTLKISPLQVNFLWGRNDVKTGIEHELGRRTCDREVASSSPAVALPGDYTIVLEPILG